MSIPVVHGPTYSTYVRSVRIALAEKGAEYALRDVQMLQGAHKLPSFLALNPFGKVPAFQHQGATIYETSAILRYIDRAFPQPPLTPADPLQAARMDQAMGIIDSFGYACIIGQLVWQRLVMPMLGGHPDESVVAASIEPVTLCLYEFDRLLGAGAYFGGADLSLADIHLAPVFGYLMGTQEGRDLASANLHQWWERVSSRESVMSTQPSFD